MLVAFLIQASIQLPYLYGIWEENLASIKESIWNIDNLKKENSLDYKSFLIHFLFLLYFPCYLTRR